MMTMGVGRVEGQTSVLMLADDDNGNKLLFKQPCIPNSIFLPFLLFEN